MPDPATTLLVGGAGGIAATEILDRASVSQEERILEAIEKCIYSVEELTHEIANWGQREREKTSSTERLFGVFGGAIDDFVPASTFRCTWLVLNNSNAGTVTMEIGTQSIPLAIGQNALVSMPFGITLNGGTVFRLTPSVGTVVALLSGYYERREIMGR